MDQVMSTPDMHIRITGLTAIGFITGIAITFTNLRPVAVL
jgi:hypothetical protein